MLVRDGYLLRGLAAFAPHRVAGVSAVAVIRRGSVGPFGTPDVVTAALTVLGGLSASGTLSTLANGCPFRQHVLAAQASSAPARISRVFRRCSDVSSVGGAAAAPVVAVKQTCEDPPLRP